MAEFVPHSVNWQTVEKYRKMASVVFYIGVALSLLAALKEYTVFHRVLFDHPATSQWISTLINAVTILSLIIYPILDAYIEYGLAPAAEDKRRDDFLDNAFGSRFSEKNSIGYYTNEAINPGFYKAAVNLFENSFFTYRVTDAMLVKKIIPVVLVLGIVVLLAIPGWGQQPLALPVLQLFFSSAIIIDFIKFWLLRSHTKKNYERWRDLFRTAVITKNSASQTPEILRYWLLYETTLARLQMGLDSKIFNDLNSQLSQEWEMTKSKLNITTPL